MGIHQAYSKGNERKILLLRGQDDHEAGQLIKDLVTVGYDVLQVTVVEAKEQMKSVDELVLVLLDDDITFDLVSNCASFIRKTAATLPILLLCHAERYDPEELNQLFTAGVNDYVIKPVRVEELVIRMEHATTQLIAEEEAEVRVIHINDLRIDPSKREVYRDGDTLQLTVKEFDLLYYLVKHADMVCSRDAILRDVWHVDFKLGTNVVDVYIKHLREKVDKGRRKKLIHTVRGVGYMLKTEASNGN